MLQKSDEAKDPLSSREELMLLWLSEQYPEGMTMKGREKLARIKRDRPEIGPDNIAFEILLGALGK